MTTIQYSVKVKWNLQDRLQPLHTVKSTTHETFTNAVLQGVLYWPTNKCKSMTNTISVTELDGMNYKMMNFLLDERQGQLKLCECLVSWSWKTEIHFVPKHSAQI